MSTNADTELAAQRLEKIRQILRERHVARVAALSREFVVSPATIRRDLLDLESRGQVRRVHGGVVALDGRLDEPDFEDKTELASRQKQRIAAAALTLTKPTDSVFLDGGSTVLALAHLLGGMSQLTVVTNSLRVATVFSAEGPRLIVAGGEFRRLSQTLVGTLTRPLLEQLRVDTAFMGTIGLTAREGLTTTDPREAYTKEIVMAHARRVMLLADSTKIGKMSFVRFGTLDQVDVLITDKGVGRRELAELKKKVKVVCV